MVVFSHLDFENIRSVAERYRHIIEKKTLNIPGHSLNMIMSLGLAWVPSGGITSQDSLIELTDSALYIAKNSGRNQLKTNVFAQAISMHN
jgi:diguanylate cyclase